MDGEIEYNPIEALIRYLDEKTISPEPQDKELQMLAKQLNKAVLVFEHKRYQEEAEAVRKKIGIEELGFKTEEEALNFLKNTVNQSEFTATLKELMEKFNASSRWYLAFGYNLLMNTSKVPFSYIPPVMEMYIPNNRDRLMVEIFKDTTLADIKDMWKLIEQQKSALKPNDETRSDKKVELMVWNESTGKCEFVNAGPSRRNRQSDLYKRGRLILDLRSQGFSDSEIATKIESDATLTYKDVSDIAYQYENILKDIYLQ